MNRRLAAEMSRLRVENLGNSALLPALFALIRNISSRHPSGPELIRGSFTRLLTRRRVMHFQGKFNAMGTPSPARASGRTPVFWHYYTTGVGLGNKDAQKKGPGQNALHPGLGVGACRAIPTGGALSLDPGQLPGGAGIARQFLDDDITIARGLIELRVPETDIG